MINKAPVAKEQPTKTARGSEENSAPHFDTAQTSSATSEDKNPSYAVKGETRPELAELHPKADLTTKLVMSAAVGFPIIGCVAAGALMWAYGWMGWSYLAMVVFGWCLTSLGITVGFHRLMSHKSFETYRWVRIFWMVVGALSVEGLSLIHI